jgi:hypothetical protein
MESNLFELRITPHGIVTPAAPPETVKEPIY